MRRVTFYRASLFAPLALPAIAAAALFVAPDLFLFPALVLGFSVIFVGVPYLLFVALLLRWTRHRTPTEIERAAWRWPLYFAPVGGTCFVLWYVRIAEGPLELIWSFSNGVMLTAVFGYGYVLAVRALALLIPSTSAPGGQVPKIAADGHEAS